MELSIVELSQLKPIVFPFVDKMVETLYNDCEQLVSDHIETYEEKNIFMMFIIMYFAVHLKVRDTLYNCFSESERKNALKNILSHILRNPEQRTACLQMFETQFRSMFTKPVNSLTDKN
jgi:hypothetical protein